MDGNDPQGGGIAVAEAAGEGLGQSGAASCGIEFSGPVRGNWPNYSKLADGRHHCHLKKGKPTYVAVWSEDKATVTVEVIYVGTHEKAPY